jgi:two-component system phosphate regulon response regulator PhoB
MKLRQLVLLAEPSQALASALHAGLRSKGFDVSVVHRLREALSAAQSLASDVVVLNEKLLDTGDVELRLALTALRADPHLPVIIYRANVVGRARQGFVIDPSLYSSEPVTLARFCQRVAALSRPRSTRMVSAELSAGCLRVDTIGHRVYVDESEVLLTALEFRLLVAFMSAGDRVLSREGLLLDVWGIRSREVTRTVDTNVKRLRQKLGRAAHQIQTLRNVGYRFAGPSSSPEGAEAVHHQGPGWPPRSGSAHLEQAQATAGSQHALAYAGMANSQGASGTSNDSGDSPPGEAS